MLSVAEIANLLTVFLFLINTLLSEAQPSDLYAGNKVWRAVKKNNCAKYYQHRDVFEAILKNIMDYGIDVKTHSCELAHLASVWHSDIYSYGTNYKKLEKHFLQFEGKFLGVTQATIKFCKNGREICKFSKFRPGLKKVRH